MAPSASKQKRLAEKAAKQAAGKKDGATDSTTTTPTGSVNGGSALGTPLTNTSAATSTDDLTSMTKLQIATDRCVSFAANRLHADSFVGVQLEFSYLTRRGETSKSILSICLFTDGY